MRNRMGIYLLGTAALAFGLTLSTKAELGVAPVITLPYTLCRILPLDFAAATAVVYFLFVIFQLILKKNGSKGRILLQFPFSIAFSALLRLFSNRLPTPNTMLLRAFLLVVSLFATAGGIFLMVGANLIASPADALAYAISGVIRKNPGTGKNILDASCVCLSLLLSLAAGRGITGVGLGTVVSMVCVGRLLALFNAAGKTQLLQMTGQASSCRNIVTGEKYAGNE